MTEYTKKLVRKIIIGANCFYNDKRKTIKDYFLKDVITGNGNLVSRPVILFTDETIGWNIDRCTFCYTSKQYEMKNTVAEVFV
jgi:acetyltransferase-like isoleucine patch superfamily enzyme